MMIVSCFHEQTKKHDFHSKLAEEYALLRKDQAKLHHTTGRNMFVGLSTTDTIRQCIRIGNTKGALDLRRQFGISDKYVDMCIQDPTAIAKVVLQLIPIGNLLSSVALVTKQLICGLLFSGTSTG